MAAITVTGPAAAAPTERRSSFGDAVADTLAIAGRNLRAMARVPEVIVFSTIQPIIFVLTFRYVFGGSIRVPGAIPYVDFLMPGVFVQTVAFGAMNTGIGLSEDLHKGLIERFRSLPMARSAVLAGRTLADLVRNVFVVLLMLVVGFMVGFRVHTNVFAALVAIVLVMLFGYAVSWIFASVGLMVHDPETAQAAVFPVMAPLVFASTAFVPLKTMPGWLQAFAAHQPVSATVDAARALLVGGPTAGHVVAAFAWIAGVLVLFAPMAVHRYRKLT